jgi:hypothetical protein
MHHVYILSLKCTGMSLCGVLLSVRLRLCDAVDLSTMTAGHLSVDPLAHFCPCQWSSHPVCQSKGMSLT